MRMPVVVVLALVAKSSTADAERVPVISVGGGLVGAEDSEHVVVPGGGPFVSIAMERSQPEMPAKPGATFSGAIAPEILAGWTFDKNHQEGLFALGVRFDLRLAQNEPYTVRLGMQLVARGLVTTTRDPGFEAGLGEYVYVADHVRIFGDQGLAVIRRDDTADRNRLSIIVLAGVGFDL